MALAAANARRAVKTTAPDDLPGRAAAATTEARLAELFRDLWPHRQDAAFEAAALDGFLSASRSAGDPHGRPGQAERTAPR